MEGLLSTGPTPSSFELDGGRSVMDGADPIYLCNFHDSFYCCVCLCCCIIIIFIIIIIIITMNIFITIIITVIIISIKLINVMSDVKENYVEEVPGHLVALFRGSR